MEWIMVQRIVTALIATEMIAPNPQASNNIIMLASLTTVHARACMVSPQMATATTDDPERVDDSDGSDR
jgi:hypothetical protein